jgi:hypothetical protein
MAAPGVLPGSAREREPRAVNQVMALRGGRCGRIIVQSNEARDCKSQYAAGSRDVTDL